MLARPSLHALVLGLAVGLAAHLLGAASADAQTIRAAAMPPQLRAGEATPELRDKFHEVIVQGLGSLSGPSGPNGELGDVLGAGDTRAKLGPELSGCGNDMSCVPRAASVLKVNRLVVTDLSVTGKSYSITMRLYDGAGRELTHAQELCDICTVHEAEEAMTKTSARLAAAARTFPIDTVVAPVEPVRVEKRPEPPPVVESPMEDTPVLVQLPPRRENHRDVPWRILGFASIGVAVVGLAVGVPLLVLNGHPTCSASDPTHECPRLYHTKAGGAVMTTFGVLGILGAIPLFYLDYREKQHSMASLGLHFASSKSGGGLVLGGSF